MVNNLSPYAEAESGAPSWKVGEREAAIVFLSLTLYIILDVNVAIYRVFKKKQGLYYWSLIFATWGTAAVAVGNIFKNLKPEWGVIWPLWTLLINGGWSVYAPAELLVLYSRLHLVNQNQRLHRWLLIMIIVGSTLIIIPNWVFVFGAYDIDPKVSSVWSPRMAIIDRVSQAGFTLFETIISCVYINSLLEILRTKITMRTRRVMRDLIFVNALVITMDLLVIILIFLNQANLAYPLQDCIYAFKYKIEFAVLNQLMAVAASGSRRVLQRTTFEDRRYRGTGQTTILKGYSDDDLGSVRLPFLSLSTGSKASSPSTLVGSEKRLAQIESNDHANVTKPNPCIRKERSRPILDPLGRDPEGTHEHVYDDNYAFPPGPDLGFSSPSPAGYEMTPSLENMREKKSEDILLAPIADDGNGLTLAATPAHQVRSQQRKTANRVSLRQLLFRKPKEVDVDHGDNEKISSESSRNVDVRSQDDIMRDRIAPFGAHVPEFKHPTDTRETNSRSKGRPSYRRLGSRRKEPREQDENDEDEEGVHAWERPGSGRKALEAPWFQRSETTQRPAGKSDKRV